MAERFPPGREADLVTFTRNFAAKIAADPERYSLSASQASAYQALSQAFVDAYAVANNGATRSPMNLTLKDAAMAALVADLRAFARIVQNAPTTTNAIRDELNLPRRGTAPSPRPPPATPNRFAVSLDATGALTLKWKCTHPRGSTGTIYQVWRRIGPAGEFTYLGSAGAKRFTDTTLPAGTAQATYQVQAVRSTAAGASAQHIVNFGVTNATPMMQAVAEEAPVRRAA